MTNIETCEVMLSTGRGKHQTGYLARPQGDARRTCVIVLHDMFGLNEPIREIADGYARRGFVALVPNLFWRSSNPNAIPYDDAQHPAAWARLKALKLGLAAVDIGMWVDLLRGKTYCNGKVGAVGFCGGGRLAFLAAARSGVDAAASLYGLGISEHLGELGNVKCPLQLHYGQRDQHIPKAEIDTVANGVQGHAGTEVLLYPEAGHSFANPVRPTYDPAATALAFERIDAMLKRL